MTSSVTFNVAHDFTPYINGRFIQDGPGSGEALRDQIAILLKAHDHVLVDLTGVRGCPSSCLEEAFGGLARHAKGYGLDPASLPARIAVRSATISTDAAEAQGYLADALRSSDIKGDDAGDA